MYNAFGICGHSYINLPCVKKSVGFCVVKYGVALNYVETKGEWLVELWASWGADLV